MAQGTFGNSLTSGGSRGGFPPYGGGSSYLSQNPYLYPQGRRNSFNTDIYGAPQLQQNPAYNNAGKGAGGYVPQDVGGTVSNAGGNAAAGGAGGGVFGNISGGGDVNFSNAGQPEGFNPYQFMPSFQNFERPASPVAGLSPEEEFLRQYGMGQLLGAQPGYDAAFNEAMATTTGQYLHPESNPYLRQQIGALGEDTTNQLNRSVNEILSRAGTSGALGGSRSALMQGAAGGEATRGFAQQVADLLSGNYQQERGRQQAATSFLPQLEQMPFQRTQQAQQLASVPRQLEQQLIDAQRQEILRQQSERLLPFQLGQSVLGQRMGQTIPVANPAGGGMAGFGSLLGGMGSLMGGMGRMGIGFS